MSESNQDLWERLLEEMGSGLENFSPLPKEEAEPISAFPLMLYKNKEPYCIVLDEEELESAYSFGWRVHPNMEEP